MTKDEYLKYHSEMCDRMKATTKAKNSDYTGDSEDPFFNFSGVEILKVASVEQGFLTRMLDKYCRINTFAKKGVLQVKDESVEDTLIDLANYCLLFAGYLKSKRLDPRLFVPHVSGEDPADTARYLRDRIENARPFNCRSVLVPLLNIKKARKKKKR